MTIRNSAALLATLEGYGLQEGDYLTQGSIFFLDSGHGSAADSVSNGTSWDTPFATLDFALGQCTASAGDVIYVASRHTETIATATALAVDVAGVAIIGLGSGNLRPTFSIGATGVTGCIFNIDAANVLVRNLILKPVAVDTTLLMDIDGAGVTVDNCYFEMDIGSYEACTAIDVATDDCVIKDCVFTCTGDGGARAIAISSTVDNLRIEGCHVEGDWDNAGIWSDQVFTNALIINNFVSNVATGQHAIEFSAAGTGILANNRLYSDTPGIVLDPGSMKCAGNLAVDAINRGGVPVPAVTDTAGSGSGTDVGGLGTSPGNEWYVDSGQGGNATGISWEDAVATLDAAVNLATANNGDVIYVAPGHAENLTAAESLDIDKAGLTIIGVGTGADIPTLSLTTAGTATVKIDAASCTLKNLKILSNYTGGIAEGINITGNGDDCTIEDCWFAETSSTKEMLIAISAAADADRLTIRNNKFIGISGGSDTNAIVFEGATDESIVEGNYFWGDWSDYVIDGATAAGTMLLIKDNVIHNVDTGAGLTIGLHGSSTGTVLGNRCYGAKAGIGIVALGTAQMDNVVVNAVNRASRVDKTLDTYGETAISGKKYYVDSATGSDAAGAGYTWELPCASIDYAISNRATANNGDIIYVAAGHAEDLAEAQIDLDVAGTSIIGLGSGPDRPRIDFNHANSSFDIGANGCTLKNLTFRPSVTVVAIGVDIEAGVTHTTIENCEFMDGEAGDGTDEFVIGIDLKAGCNYTTIRNNKFTTHASCDGCTCAIKLSGASTHPLIEGNDIRGQYSTACINGITTLSTDILIKGNILQPKDTEPGIELLTGTTGIICDNYIATNLATKAAAIVCDAAYLFENYYCEAVTETGGLIGTASVDD